MSILGVVWVFILVLEFIVLNGKGFLVLGSFWVWLVLGLILGSAFDLLIFRFDCISSC